MAQSMSARGRGCLCSCSCVLVCCVVCTKALYSSSLPLGAVPRVVSPWPISCKYSVRAARSAFGGVPSWKVWVCA
eukprot:1187027-Rhodomonas_salina.4